MMVTSSLETAFEKKYGYRLSDFLTCLWALSTIFLVPSQPNILVPQNEAAGTEVDWAKLHIWLNIFQRAYTTFAGTGLEGEVWKRIQEIDSGFAKPDRRSVGAVLTDLTLSLAHRKNIGLWSGGRRYPLIPFSDAMVIDFQGVGSLLHSLFVGIQYEQSGRGTVFEDSFRNALTGHGWALEKVGIIRNLADAVREIDASIRVGQKLVVFECRTIERPLDYEIGRPTTMARRQQLLDEKVEQVLTLRNFIRAAPVGKNYDFSWAKEVLAFVITPFVEWIWDESERLWHDTTTPRILQAGEAIAYLERLS